MPLKGYKHSEEVKAIRKEQYKGFSNSGTFKKGNKSWNEGKKRPPFSKEWKTKLAESHKGNKNASAKNFKRTEEYCKKLSLACKGIPKSEEMKKKMRGANSILWKGGISFEPYSMDWTGTLKRSIRERDHYLCRICGLPQGDLSHDIHHIDYNKKNCNPINLITLCHPCHSRTNQNRDKWLKYFQELIKQ